MKLGKIKGVAVAVIAAALLAGVVGSASASNSAFAGNAELMNHRMIKRQSAITTQRVLNRIHDILPLFDGSSSKNSPPILPTKAYLMASEGGFRAKCRPPNKEKRGVVYPYYKITPAGEWYTRCSQIGTLWPTQIRINEFKRPLQRLGVSIARSIRLDLKGQEVFRIKGNRAGVTVKLRCPDTIPAETEDYIDEIILRRARNGSRASIAPCTQGHLADPRVDSASKSSRLRSTGGKRRSPIRLQRIIDLITYRANPVELQGKSHPVRAFMSRSAAGYWSPGCRDAFYSKFVKQLAGISYSTCAAFPPGYWPGSGKDITKDHSRPNEYESKLRKLTGMILRSVDLKLEGQQVRRISGSRKRLRVVLVCSGTRPGDAGVETVSVSSIPSGSKVSANHCR